MPIKKISPALAGPWLDGGQWENAAHIVDIARAHGFTTTRDERAALRLYLFHDPARTAQYNRGDTLTYDEAVTWVTGPGEISDKATAYLQQRAPRGYVVHWDAGDVGLYHEAALPDYAGPDRDGALREAFAWQDALEQLDKGCQDGFFNLLNPYRRDLLKAHEIDDPGERTAAVKRIVKRMRTVAGPITPTGIAMYGGGVFTLAVLITGNEFIAA